MVWFSSSSCKNSLDLSLGILGAFHHMSNSYCRYTLLTWSCLIRGGGGGVYINFLTKILQNLVAVKFKSSALGCHVSALLSANSLSFPQGSTVCLADFCDIFRCEVFESQRKDYFWEKKLCKEDKLMVRRRRCEVAGASISKTTF